MKNYNPQDFLVKVETNSFSLVNMNIMNMYTHIYILENDDVLHFIVIYIWNVYQVASKMIQTHVFAIYLFTILCRFLV